MTTITARSQTNEGNNYIELFTLDATSLGGSIYHFTNSMPPETGTISFNSITYTSLPIQATGFEMAADGTQAKPKLAISNVNRLLTATVVGLGDLVGAKLTRIHTFTHYLDGEAGADGSVHFPTDVFYIEQKVQHDNEYIVWQLCSVIDRMGVMLPRRQITRQGDTRFDNGFKGVGWGRY